MIITQLVNVRINFREPWRDVSSIAVWLNAHRVSCLCSDKLSANSRSAYLVTLHSCRSAFVR